jgi:leucyl-tRNA synthetase
VILTAPFAPHIAEELYQRLGHNDGLFGTARWPGFDPAKTRADTVEIAIQVNGKLRGRLPVDAGAREADVRAQALVLDNVARHVGDRPIAKAIFVPDKLLNLVLG